MGSLFMQKYNTGFTFLPNDYFNLLSSGALTSQEFCLLLHIKSFQNFKSHDTSIRQLSSALRMHRNTITKGLKKLEQKSFIKIIKGKDEHFFIIKFLLHDVISSKKTTESSFEIKVNEDENEQSDKSNWYKSVPVKGGGRYKSVPEAGTNMYHLELNEEINNKTNEQSDDCPKVLNIPDKKKKEKFDFESLYKKYPRKLGKSKGIEYCKRTIKTDEDYQLFKQAMDNAVSYYRDKEDRFIPHFSTFMNKWRDYLEMQIDNSEEKFTPSQKETMEYLTRISKGE